MRHRIVGRGGRALGVGLLGTLVIMATTVVAGSPPAGAAVSATTPWALMKTPYLFGNHTSDALTGVSCPTSTWCLAVGGVGTSSPETKPLAEEWSGGTKSAWKEVTTTGLPAGETRLFHVSCAFPTYCMAIGSTESSPSSSTNFAALWNGSAWSVTLSSTPSSTGLVSVSCASTNCMAVGDTFAIENGSVINTMVAQYWDGRSWTASLNGTPGALDSVSCFSATQCLAVGASTLPVSSIDTALAEYFDNGTWTAEPPPNPYMYRTSNTDGLLATSCEGATQPTMCLAVGVGTYNDDEQLAEFWNASTGGWTVSLPASGSSTGPLGTLTAASCATTTWCIAAQYGGAAPTAWDGSAWTTMDAKAVDGTSTNRANPFNALACPSSTFCVAVGSKDALVGEQSEVASWGTVP